MWLNETVRIKTVLSFSIALSVMSRWGCGVRGWREKWNAHAGADPMSEHTHLRGYLAKPNPRCPACREERRYEIEMEADFWGGTVTWDEDDE